MYDATLNFFKILEFEPLEDRSNSCSESPCLLDAIPLGVTLSSGAPFHPPNINHTVEFGVIS
jgi:hypothetical protein